MGQVERRTLTTSTRSVMDDQNSREPQKQRRQESKTRMSSKHQNRLKHLVSKLLILLIVNVTATLFFLIIVYQWMIYAAASMDLLVSNICLLLTFKFNESYFFKYCKLCVHCCYR